MGPFRAGFSRYKWKFMFVACDYYEALPEMSATC